MGVMKHKAGNTEFEVEVINNRTNSLDTRWVNRYPGELKPYPALTATSPTLLADNALANNPIFGFDTQGSKANVMTYTGKFETKFTETIALFGGLSYQDASADISGNRQMTLTIRTTPGLVNSVGGFVANGRPPYSYTTVTGKTNETILTGNIGVNYTPQKDFRLSLALKHEQSDMDGSNQVTYVNNLIVQTTGAITPVNFPAPNISTRNYKTWVPELTFRYSGIKDLALYGSFDYRHSPGHYRSAGVEARNGKSPRRSVHFFIRVRSAPADQACSPGPYR